MIVDYYAALLLLSPVDERPRLSIPLIAGENLRPFCRNCVYLDETYSDIGGQSWNSS